MNRSNNIRCCARVNFVGEYGTLIGRNVGTRDVIGFHAGHLLKYMFRPCHVRISPGIHHAAATAVDPPGVNLDRWPEAVTREAVGGTPEVPAASAPKIFGKFIASD